MIVKHILSVASLAFFGCLLGAQARPGAISISFTVGGTHLRLFHVSRPSDMSNQMHLRNVVGAEAITFTSLSMPFDSPGDALALEEGVVVVSGFHSGTSIGYVCRLDVTGGLSPGAAIVQAVPIAGCDPARLVFNAAESLLYVYDVAGRRVRVGAWTGSGALPAFDTIIDVSSAGFWPSHADLGGNGESPSGIYLRERPRGLRDGSVEPERRIHVYGVGAPAAWHADEETVTPILLPPIRWEVETLASVSVSGPVLVRGKLGGIDIVHVPSGSVVATGSSADASVWTPVVPFSDMIPGDPYQVAFSYPQASRVFYPTYRAGLPSESSGYRMRKGYFMPPALSVGNSRFTVWSSIDYVGAGAPADGKVVSYLWVKVGFLDGATVEMPNGVVLLAAPDVAVGPAPDDTPVDPVTRSNLMRYRVPIPDNEQVAGVPLLFQFVTVNPMGEYGVSDVFGSVIKSEAVAGLAAGGEALGTSSQQPGLEVDVAEQAQNFLARVAACRAWLTQIGLPDSSRSEHVKAVQGAMRSKRD